MGFWDLVLPGQGSGNSKALVPVKRELVPVRREPEAPPVARATFQGGSHRQPEPAIEPVFEPAGGGRKERRASGVLGDCFQQGGCGTCDKNPEFCPIAKTHLPKVEWTPCGGIYA
jgi:hypothetical protein